MSSLFIRRDYSDLGPLIYSDNKCKIYHANYDYYKQEHRYYAVYSRKSTDTCYFINFENFLIFKDGNDNIPPITSFRKQIAAAIKMDEMLTPQIKALRDDLLSDEWTTSRRLLAEYVKNLNDKSLIDVNGLTQSATLKFTSLVRMLAYIFGRQLDSIIDVLSVYEVFLLEKLIPETVIIDPEDCETFLDVFDYCREAGELDETAIQHFKNIEHFAFVRYYFGWDYDMEIPSNTDVFAIIDYILVTYTNELVELPRDRVPRLPARYKLFALVHNNQFVNLYYRSNDIDDEENVVKRLVFVAEGDDIVAVIDCWNQGVNFLTEAIGTKALEGKNINITKYSFDITEAFGMLENTSVHRQLAGELEGDVRSNYMFDN